MAFTEAYCITWTSKLQTWTFVLVKVCTHWWIFHLNCICFEQTNNKDTDWRTIRRRLKAGSLRCFSHNSVIKTILRKPQYFGKTYFTVFFRWTKNPGSPCYIIKHLIFLVFNISEHLVISEKKLIFVEGDFYTHVYWYI